MRHFAVAVATALLPVALHAGTAGAPYDPGLAPFTIRFAEETIRHSPMAVFLLPGESVSVSVPENAGHEFTLRAENGELSSGGSSRWRWTAPPSPGMTVLRLSRNDGNRFEIIAFVLRPASAMADGRLNGYQIGHYPPHPLKGDPMYLAPRGFVEVTEDMLDAPVSPHFRLGQFLCKQQPEAWPKYLVLRTALLTKLELVLAEVNRRGIRSDSFFVMSGYRTPHYNAAIGNVPYSRHVFGGAADIFIDRDGDGIMDDLNGDGRLDIGDARMLHGIVRDMSDNGMFRRLLGGLGLYGPRVHRGAFVHVDARGNRSRWELP